MLQLRQERDGKRGQISLKLFPFIPNYFHLFIEFGYHFCCYSLYGALLAPSQDRPYNFTSDVWSLGVVLYEASRQIESEKL